MTQSKDPKPKQVEVRNNVSLLVNQTDQIPNLLSGYHAKGKLQGNILDLTMRKFRFLYLLYAKSITILDCKQLLASDGDVSIVQSIQLNVSPNQLNEFSFLEVTDTPDQSLLLFTDIASRKPGEKAVAPAGILHIDCSEFAGKQSQAAHKQTLLQLASTDTLGGGKSDSLTIFDVEIWDKYLAVLTEKNTVFVFSVARGGTGASDSEEVRPIFKAQFKDATDQISQIFFVSDFMSERKGSQSSEESSEPEDPA